MNRSSLALPRSSEVGQCGQRLLRQNLFDIDSSKRFFVRRRCCCVQSICPSKVMDCWNACCRWLAKVMNTHPPHSQQRLVVATAVKDSNPVSLLVSGYPFENYWLVSKRTDSRKGFQVIFCRSNNKLEVNTNTSWRTFKLWTPINCSTVIYFHFMFSHQFISYFPVKQPQWSKSPHFQSPSQVAFFRMFCCFHPSFQHEPIWRCLKIGYLGSSITVNHITFPIFMLFLLGVIIWVTKNWVPLNP